MAQFCQSCVEYQDRKEDLHKDGCLNYVKEDYEVRNVTFDRNGHPIRDVYLFGGCRSAWWGFDDLIPC